ncbi:MAG: hypothetical protein AB3N16_08200 [Flavobacteriaceae bacterium]
MEHPHKNIFKKNAPLRPIGSLATNWSLNTVCALALLVSCSKEEGSKIEAKPTLLAPPIEMSAVTSFIAFGEELTPQQKNPALEYVANTSSLPVRAVCSGYIEKIVLNQHIADYEIRIRLSPNSPWLIIYDHIIAPEVSEGDSVVSQDILGTIGLGNRTELQINHESGNHQIAHCPLQFGTVSFVRAHTDISPSWCLEDTVTP